ncbi:uncharacterized protein LOC107304667 isoform X2 [Oryza brachyantha]|uniref:uncharacterized protein LOC107304667 isoform X2 n=1 Tax=Oryza brachyantha TaxID=4533 RepID=UPI00077668A6|nr:uncharacterized protein LOC107304667 isoform X2 [Oryza brachyantha]
MSRRMKREVAPAPSTIGNSSARSSSPSGIQIPSAAPYPYGGLLFPNPLPSWFPFPPSQSMAGSSSYRPSTDKTDAQLDLEQWGLESRPLGDFVNFIKTPANAIQHVAIESPSQPVHVDNGDASRTEKCLSWTQEEDLRLVSAWLNNSNDPIESNFKKNDKYWADVAAAYNNTTPNSRLRQIKQVKDRFLKIKKKIPQPIGVKVAKAQRIGKGKEYIS